MNKDAKRDDRKILKLIIGVTASALLFIVLFIVFFLYAYTPVERLEESYGMNVCFWDHGEQVQVGPYPAFYYIQNITIYDHGIEIHYKQSESIYGGLVHVLLYTVQKANLQGKCTIFEVDVNLLKQQGEIVEVDFKEPVNITISQWIRPEDRNHILTDERGYRILTNIEKIIFVLKGRYEGHILTKSVDEVRYGCWAIAKDGMIDKSWIDEVKNIINPPR